MSVRRTGVFVTPEEKADALQRSIDVQTTPVAFVHGRWLHEVAREAFMTWLDKLATTHGLPEPRLIGDVVNHYGLSNEGEFTVWEAD